MVWYFCVMTGFETDGSELTFGNEPQGIIEDGEEPPCPSGGRFLDPGEAEREREALRDGMDLPQKANEGFSKLTPSLLDCPLFSAST